MQILLAVIHRSHSCFAAFDEWNNPKLMQWLVLFKIRAMRTIPWTKPLTETGKVILSLNHLSTTKRLSGNLDQCAFSKEEPDPSMNCRDSVKSKPKQPFKPFPISFVAFSSSLLYARLTQTSLAQAAPQNAGVWFSLLIRPGSWVLLKAYNTLHCHVRPEHTHLKTSINNPKYITEISLYMDP